MIVFQRPKLNAPTDKGGVSEVTITGQQSWFWICHHVTQFLTTRASVYPSANERGRQRAPLRSQVTDAILGFPADSHTTPPTSAQWAPRPCTPRHLLTRSTPHTQRAAQPGGQRSPRLGHIPYDLLAGHQSISPVCHDCCHFMSLY